MCRRRNSFDSLSGKRKIIVPISLSFFHLNFFLLSLRSLLVLHHPYEKSTTASFPKNGCITLNSLLRDERMIYRLNFVKGGHIATNSFKEWCGFSFFLSFFLSCSYYWFTCSVSFVKYSWSSVDLCWELFGPIFYMKVSPCIWLPHSHLDLSLSLSLSIYLSIDRRQFISISIYL